MGGIVRPLFVMLLLSRVVLAADPAPVAGTHGMVVTAQHLATDVGVEVLRRGGNAVDAAVAVGYALAVVYPAAGNLGGGGFMTVRMADGTTGFLDFREKAPGRATAGMYLDGAGNVVPGRSTEGWLAVGVPGSVAGLEAARVRWGGMSRAELMAPAVRLAREGFLVTEGDLRLLNSELEGLARDPAAWAIFAPGVGRRLGAGGERLVQADLARTLETLAQEGPDAFYRGPIGDAVVAASRVGGGILEKADLEGYRVREMAPVTCGYRGFEVISAPPPSSGGVVLCEMLNVLEGYDLKGMGFHSAASVQVMVEAMRRAYFDRNNRLGDPEFVQNPVAELVDKGYAARVRGMIVRGQATPSGSVTEVPHEGSNTTHYAVVDGAGNAVSVTYTLNGWFGAKVVAGGTGIVMNNEMDDFAAKPGASNGFGLVQRAANVVAPGKTPLSSMAPTILVRDGRLALVLGSPGGSRIPTTVLQVILNMVDYGMDVQAAIDAPRVHHQWMPDTVLAERFALSADTRTVLQWWGYKVEEHPNWGIAEGIRGPGWFVPPPPSPDGNFAIYLRESNLAGAHDPRGGAGLAEGY